MKLLFFTLCCSFTGVLFAGGYAASEITAIEPLDTSFNCAALSNAEDKSDVDDLDALGFDNHKHSLAPSYAVSHSKICLLVNSQLDVYYHTRAPPFII